MTTRILPLLLATFMFSETIIMKLSRTHPKSQSPRRPRGFDYWLVTVALICCLGRWCVAAESTVGQARVYKKVGDRELRLFVVHPDGVWYDGLTAEHVPEFVEQHILGGKPVERFVLRHLKPVTAVPVHFVEGGDCCGDKLTPEQQAEALARGTATGQGAAR